MSPSNTVRGVTDVDRDITRSGSGVFVLDNRIDVRLRSGMAFSGSARADLTTVDGSALDETGLVDAIRGLEDLKAQAAAAQARLVRELDAQVRERHRAQGVRAAQRGRDVAGLVAFARRESPARGSRFVGFARALVELPHTAAAMPNMMVKRRSMLMPRRPTVSRSAMPARTTIPKVVNCRKAKTPPMISAAKAK